MGIDVLYKYIHIFFHSLVHPDVSYLELSVPMHPPDERSHVMISNMRTHLSTLQKLFWYIYKNKRINLLSIKLKDTENVIKYVM